MTTPALPSPPSASPTDLPPVERRAVVPPGFVAGGTSCGIKASGRPDLAVIAATGRPAAAAAVFTGNAFAAAPVRLCQRHLRATEPGSGGYGRSLAVVSTSGSANAATGAAGDADQAEIAAALAAALGSVPELTLAMSTGVIGTRLPVDRVRAGIDALVGSGLSADPAALEAAAEALRTTDSRAKLATTRAILPGSDGEPAEVAVSGIAKGVGMIHPGMATMLSVVLTDADIEPEVLYRLLRGAVSRTWNQLSVDGDTSTNDTVIALASGTTGTTPVAPGSDAAAALGRAIEAVARDLARQQAADGEGATTLITCRVAGAADDAEARAIARAVVSSSLVKAAIHGRDPNWGRIAGAAGNARLPDGRLLAAAGLGTAEAELRAGRPARLDPDRLRIEIAGELVYDGTAGGPVAFDRDRARAAMDADEVVLALDAGLGAGVGEAFGCDLSETYVRENSEYTT